MGVLLALVIMVLLLGLARSGGLPVQIVLMMGGDDRKMHAIAGFLVSMVVFWIMGAKRFRIGLLGLVLVAGLGALGEVLQGILSQRNVELSDFVAHLVGCIAALPIYLLCMGAKLCESPDARKPDKVDSAYL